MYASHIHVVSQQEVLQGIGEVKEVRERSLTGTWDISDLQRWKWETSGEIDKNGKILSTKVQNQHNRLAHIGEIFERTCDRESE